MKTTNYNLVKSDENDFYDINIVNSNLDSIDAALLNIYETASGTGTTITLTNVKLVNGCPKNFICSLNNNGSATTINGLPLYKVASTNAPTLVAQKQYTIIYNLKNNCFFVKASATGDAKSSEVLITKKFSNDTDTDLVGTMPNNGPLNGALNCGASYTVPVGYTSGGTITANSLASQTVSSASANQILYGLTAWINGVKVTGTMTNYTSDQNCIGYGTSGTTIGLKVPQGYWDGTHNVNVNSTSLDGDLIASNIVNDVNILGLIGTATIQSLGGKRYASGTFTMDGNRHLSVTGLSFTPSLFIAYNNQDIAFLSKQTNGVCYFVTTTSSISASSGSGNINSSGFEFWRATNYPTWTWYAWE